jgi:hypothetical protein
MNFDSRSDVIIWMIDNQKNKRNANKMTLTYLIGKQYREIKDKKGGDRKSFDVTSQYLDESKGQNDPLTQLQAVRTSNKPAKDANLNEKTVRRAAEYQRFMKV